MGYKLIVAVQYDDEPLLSEEVVFTFPEDVDYAMTHYAIQGLIRFFKKTKYFERLVDCLRKAREQVMKQKLEEMKKQKEG